MGSARAAVVFVVAWAVVACSGCGLLINGRRQKVVINTDPPGATITIASAGIVQTTPCVVKLKRHDDYTIMAQKPGYENASAMITSDLEPLSIVLDIIFWGGLALLVDYPLGANHELTPSNVFIPLRKAAGPGGF